MLDIVRDFDKHLFANLPKSVKEPVPRAILFLQSSLIRLRSRQRVRVGVSRCLYGGAVVLQSRGTAVCRTFLYRVPRSQLISVYKRIQLLSLLCPLPNYGQPSQARSAAHRAIAIVPWTVPKMPALRGRALCLWAVALAMTGRSGVLIDETTQTMPQLLAVFSPDSRSLLTFGFTAGVYALSEDGEKQSTEDDDFSDVEIEDDPFDSGNADLAAALKEGVESGNGAADEDETLTSETEGSVNAEGNSDREEEDFKNVPVESEGGAPVNDMKASERLEKLKRQAKEFQLQTAHLDRLALPAGDTLTDKDLKEAVEKEKRRQKRRRKLALDRLKQSQSGKYDPKVELAEQEASRKKVNKTLRAIRAFFENRF